MCVEREDGSVGDHRAVPRRRHRPHVRQPRARWSRASSTRSADYPDMRYVLTLQETVAVMIGDGYARARHKTDPRAAPQHARARATRSGRCTRPIGGTRRWSSSAATPGSDTCRWTPRCRRPRRDGPAGDQVVDDGRRPAVAAARRSGERSRSPSTPPMGPVYVCLPADVLDAPHGRASRCRPRSPRRAVMPEPAWIERVAELLAGARRPMIFIGDGVAYSGAQAELARVAELLGAEVWGVDSGEVNMSYAHPLYQGMTGHMFGAHSLPDHEPRRRRPDRRHLRRARGVPRARRHLRAGAPRSSTSTSTRTRSPRTTGSTWASTADPSLTLGRRGRRARGGR